MQFMSLVLLIAAMVLVPGGELEAVENPLFDRVLEFYGDLDADKKTALVFEAVPVPVRVGHDDQATWKEIPGVDLEYDSALTVASEDGATVVQLRDPTGNRYKIAPGAIDIELPLLPGMEFDYKTVREALHLQPSACRARALRAKDDVTVETVRLQAMLLLKMLIATHGADRLYLEWDGDAHGYFFSFAEGVGVFTIIDKRELTMSMVIVYFADGRLDLGCLNRIRGCCPDDR